MTTLLAAAAALTAIDGLSTLHNNPDARALEKAVANVKGGVPAFWTSASYHNQAALIFLDYANSGPLDAALLASRADDSYGPRSKRFLLGSLIPLNPEARRALEAAQVV